MNRINQLFDSNPRDLLSIYFCAGYPTLEGTTEVIRTLEKHGVNMIEIGIPFSDPMADGMVIPPRRPSATECHSDYCLNNCTTSVGM